VMGLFDILAGVRLDLLARAPQLLHAFVVEIRRKPPFVIYFTLEGALAAGIFLVHRQVERRIDQIGKL
jgi:hypothetical protein